MWGAKSLLLEGMGWRIGNGSNVRVSQDKWLFRDGSFVQLVWKNEQDRDFYVGEFINHDTKEWDIPKLLSFFLSKYG